MRTKWLVSEITNFQEQAMKQLQQQLIDFRNSLYPLFPNRRDAIFELMDANSASNGNAQSVVQLSKSPFFNREYPSITDAISTGLKDVKWPDIEKILWNFGRSAKTNYHRFIVDCTPNDRLYAKTLEDRSIVHKPNPAPSNKPICAGHEYSVVAYAPEGNSTERKRWLVPSSTKRVPSDQKGHEFGMTQLTDVIANFGLEDEMCVSIGDSAYSTPFCHQAISTKDNRIHIARLRSTRNVFELYQGDQNDKGRKKRFGRKMALSKPNTHLPHDDDLTFTETSKRGKRLCYNVKSWNTLVFRGSKKFKAEQFPFRLIQVNVADEEQKTVFKKPMWLITFGEKRCEIPLKECVDNYRDRYDIEHYFRFGKQRLLLDSFQSNKAKHDENWWKLCALSYFQLFLSKEIAGAIPEPWERYLPEFKNQASNQLVSASFAQRGFEKVLQAVGTPAKVPVPRGNPTGRKLGQTQEKAMVHPINFKYNQQDNNEKNISSGKENTKGNTKPQKIDKALQSLIKTLDAIGVSIAEFFEIALNPT